MSKEVEDQMGMESVKLTKFDEDGCFKIRFTATVMGQEFITVKTYHKEKVRDQRYDEFNPKRASILIQKHMDKAISNQLAEEANTPIKEEPSVPKKKTKKK